MFTVDPTAAAIGCALFYGTSTYLGGRAAVHIGPSRAIGLFQVTGFATALALLLLAGLKQSQLTASTIDIALALLSGIAFAVGWAFLSRGLARGRTTIVAPMECLVSVSFCAIVEGLLVGWPGMTLTVGIALAAVATAMIGWGRQEQTRSTAPVTLSVMFGILAGLFFGLSYLTLGFVSAASGIIALVVMRFFAAVGSLSWLAFERTRGEPAAEELNLYSDGSRSTGRTLALLGGICDGLGTFCFVLATVTALVGVSVAILSLYAAVTVLLGIVLLRERPSQTQVVGLTTAVAAVIILTR
jgi:drug/metabolite transporter (DMT)-like permease